MDELFLGWPFQLGTLRRAERTGAAGRLLRVQTVQVLKGKERSPSRMRRQSRARLLPTHRVSSGSLVRTLELAAALHETWLLRLSHFCSPAIRRRGVTIVTAEASPRTDLSQIACVKRLTAEHEEGLPAGPSCHLSE